MTERRPGLGSAGPLRSRHRLFVRNAGFTLIEALAALLLVAIVGPIMISAVGTTSQMAAVARDRTLAVGLAETRMNETVLDQSWQFGDALGTFEEPDVNPEDPRDWRWEIVVEDWLDASVKEMTVRVIWTRRGREHDVELSTLVSGGSL